MLNVTEHIYKNTIDNYNKTIEYHNSTGYDPKMNVIWNGNMSDIAQMVRSSTSAEQLIDKVDQAFLYSINFPPENAEDTGVWRREGDNPHIREKQIDWLLKRQTFNLFDLPENIQESKFIHQRNKVVRNGRVLSGNFLRTLSIAKQIEKYLGKVKNVLELGAGAGHQARTILLQNDCKYTIIDLPETMIFSFAHISLCFPDKKILWVTSDEDITKVDEFDIVFVPAIFADKLAGKSYDLFINTASMGEMRNDVIHRWMKYIQEDVKVDNLFTLNRYLNIVDSNHARWRVYENECSTCYDAKWDILQWELEPLYCRCPYIDTLHSRYVEIIAKRPSNLTEEECIAKSNALLQDVMDEDWQRLGNMYGGGVMQARTNILVNDCTMSGTIFKLWESIRLYKNPYNVGLLLQLFDRITVSHPFEERFYYESLKL